MRISLVALLVLGLAAGSPIASAAQAPATPPSSQTPEPPRPADEPNLLDTLRDFDDIDDLELEDLLNVTVSIAAGRAQTLEEAPSIVTVITDDEMRRAGVRTVAEALQLSPGIIVLRDNLGRGRIAIRGVSSGLTSGSSENVLVLFNGHRLNDEVSGGATVLNLDIPIDNIKKIEIIRGPGSALYGANAFLGTINIVSYTADTFQGVEVAAEGGSFATAQTSILLSRSFGRLSLAGFALVGRTDGAELLIPADVQTSVDRALAPLGIPASSLAPGRSVDDRRPIHANVTAAYGGLTINGRVADENAGGYIGVLDNLGTRNRSRTNQVTLDGTYRRTVGTDGDVSATLTYTRNASGLILDVFPPGFALVFPDRRFAVFPNGLVVDALVKSRRVGGQVVFNERLFRGNTLTAGMAVERESTFGLSSRGNFDPLTFTPRAEFGPLPPVVQDSSRSSVGVFLQDTWYPIPALGITGGVRWDHYNDFGDAVNPRAGVVWQLPRSLNLKVLYGHAFRAPSFTELFFNFPGLAGNPTLRPATIDTFEVALGYKSRDLRVSGNVYGNFLHDPIGIERPASPFFETARYINRPGIDTAGFELEVKRFFGPARWVQLGYAYQRSEDRATGGRVDDIPGHLGNAGASIGVGRFVNVTPTVLFRAGLPRSPIDPRAEVDGYVLLNLSVQGRAIANLMDVALTVDNLLDRAYFDPAPFNGVPGDYPRAGRRFLLKAWWRF